MRVLIARCFLPILIAALSVLPSRAYAIQPADLVPVATTIGATGLGTVALGVPAGTVAGASVFVGMYLGYYSVCPILNGVYGIIGGDNPCVQIPAGDTSPVSAPSAPATVAGTTAQCLRVGSTVTTVCASTNEAACLSALGRYDGDMEGGCALYPTPAGNYQGALSAWGCTPYCSASYSTVTNSCPSGYTWNSTTCALTDAYAVASNSNYKPRDYQRSGTTMTVKIVSGNSSQPLHDHVSTTTSSNDTVKVVGLAANGNLFAAEYLALPGGGATTTFQANNNNSTVSQTLISTDSAGVVTDVQNTVQSGQITVDANNIPQLAPSNPASGVPGDGVNGTLPTMDTMASSAVVQTGTNALTSAASAVASSSSFGALESTFSVAWEWFWPDSTGTVCSDIYGASGVPSVGTLGSLPDICVNGTVDKIRGLSDWVLSMGVAVYCFNLIFSKET